MYYVYRQEVLKQPIAEFLNENFTAIEHYTSEQPYIRSRLFITAADNKYVALTLKRNYNE